MRKIHAGIVSFTIDNIHSHDIISILNLENISVRAGHHCAMPLHRYIDEVSTLRLSFGIYTTKEEIDYTIESLVEIIEELRELSPLWKTFRDNKLTNEASF